MADLNDLEKDISTEEDTVAAFLAREQDQLAELEDDNLGVDSSQQPPQDDGFDPFGGESPPEAAQQPDDMFGDEGLNEDSQTGSLMDDFGGSGGPMITTESSVQDDIFGDPIMPGTPPSGGSDLFNDDLTNGPTDSYAAISQVDQLRAEPEKIKIWREEQVEVLAKKDEEEEKRQEEWRKSAKKELDDWYKHNAEQITKTKENNRAAEAAFVKERDEVTSGHNWEKICRLCEFNPKHSKNTKDISRLRSILLQLKQTPLERC